MLGREHQANTFLGNGIAIPHGMQKDRELIHHTGVSVVQLPDGVEWNSGQTVRLIVGIAAKSDEHIGVLSALTDVLDDPAVARQLGLTSDPEDIIAALNRRGSNRPRPKSSSPTPNKWKSRSSARPDCTHGRRLSSSMSLRSSVPRFSSASTANCQRKSDGVAAQTRRHRRLDHPNSRDGRRCGCGPAALREAVESGLGEKRKRKWCRMNSSGRRSRTATG